MNCDTAKHVGQPIVQSMTGRKVVNYTFRKKGRSITIGTQCLVNIKDDVVSVEPILLFQRLATAGIRNKDLPDIVSYQLNTYTPSLFESPYLMRPVKKASLADRLWSTTIKAAQKPHDRISMS